MTPAREKVLTLQKPFQILKKKFSILKKRKGLREGGKQKLEQSINENLDNQKIVKGEINGSFSILFKGFLKYIKSQTLTIS